MPISGGYVRQKPLRCVAGRIAPNITALRSDVIKPQKSKDSETPRYLSLVERKYISLSKFNSLVEGELVG